MFFYDKKNLPILRVCKYDFAQILACIRIRKCVFFKFPFAYEYANMFLVKFLSAYEYVDKFFFKFLFVYEYTDVFLIGIGFAYELTDRIFLQGKIYSIGFLHYFCDD